MAISYVGGVASGRAGATTTTTQSISGTLTGGSGTSPLQGDLIVVWCSAGTDGTGAAPNQFVSGNTSGAYLNETMQSITTVTYDTYAAVNWQFAGATPDTTITIPSSGNARNAQRWAIHVFRGVDSTTPRDVTSTTASGTATGRPNPPSITPTTAGAWILWLGSSAAATGTAYTAPTDFSADWLGGTTVDTADVMNGFGYYTGWVSGAYDPAAITAGGTTNAADSWVAKSMALRPQAAVTHTTTGALTGPGSAVAGTAKHNVPHPTSGALAGGGASIAGSAKHNIPHPTSGALTGPGAAIAGSAARTGGAVTHDTSGALAGPGSTVAGSAARTRAHPSTGALTGPGSTLAGSAARTRAHPSSGALSGAGAVLSGSAQRTGAPVTHATSGALTGSGAVVSGSASGSSVVQATTNNYAGGYTQHLWIAHINGKRHVGTYEEIQAIVEGVVEKTEKKPRIVIKPLRTVEQPKVPEATIEEAKAVQARIYMNLTPFLAKLLEKRQRDEEDDIESLMLIL